VADPVGDRGPGTGEEVVQDGDLVTEEHETVDKVRPDETGTTGD
jgi:hypothetical protein